MFDTVLVVLSAGIAFPKTNDDPDTTKRRFIPFRDQLTVVEIILEVEEADFGPKVFNVEIIRGDQTIRLKVDLKEIAHHPPPPSAETFLKPGDAMIIHPKLPIW